MSGLECDQCECALVAADATTVRDDDTQELWTLCEKCAEWREHCDEEKAMHKRMAANERYWEDRACAADEERDRRRDDEWTNQRENLK